MSSKIRELSAQETHLAYKSILELRTNLAGMSLDEFVRKVNQLQRPEGYRLLGSFEDGMPEAVAVAGFRVGHNLAWGYFLYIDDLITQADYRKRGHSGGLLQWLDQEARRLGCAELHLDSGVHRFDAHRLYLNHRMRISSHHFGKELLS